MKPERLRQAAAHATIDACKRVGREAVQALLAEFSAKKVGDIPDGNLETFIDAADELQPPPPPPPPPSDDHLIGRAYCSTYVRYEMSMDERGKELRDKLNEVGLDIVRVEKPAPAPVPLATVAFGTVVRLMGVGKAGAEYLVCVDGLSSSFNRVLVKLDDGRIQRVYQDVLVHFVRSHV